MFLVRTQSGSEYVVRNGRIDRAPKFDPYVPPDMQFGQFGTWTGRLFANVTTPTVGEAWVFTLKGTCDIVTSPVVAVETYCARCDTFGDLYFCGSAA
jgi:hypothetical protein